MKKVAVVIPARNESVSLPSLLEGVFASVPAGYEVQVVLAVNNSTLGFEQWTGNLAEKDKRICTLQLGQLHPRTFAYAYLRGLEFATRELSAEYIVEMDAGGSFDPNALPQFLDSLKTASAVFSTRFTQGGRMVHPFQRKLVSLTGTVLANLSLGLGRVVPDMTGGYEAFRAELLKSLFGLTPPDRWISANHGPGHFYQTEMRTRVCWMTTARPEVKIGLVPITMGAGKIRAPQKLSAAALCQALKSLLRLRKERDTFIEKIRSQI